MNGLLARARSLWRGVRRPSRVDAEMEEEMRFHIEMEAERRARERGIAPAEARREAAVAFGGVERYKEEGRDVRGVTRVVGLSLDFKLGLRMLARYPGLTIVAVLAMSFGIAIGAGGFEFVKDQLFPPLPYSEPGRIVRIQNVSTRTMRVEPRMLHDFAFWRGRLRSVDQLGALQLRERNLVAGTTRGVVAEAAVTAAMFDLVRRAPLLGRRLTPADEAPGAPAVVVLGYDAWRERFGADRAVVGRVVRLGREQATVVGVMPEHFAFFLPRRETTLPAPQDVWVPFRMNPLDHARAAGPAVELFGQLAPGATVERARAELATLGAVAADEWPDTHARLKPELLTFARPFSGAHGMVPTAMLSLSAVF
ncbi:MAG TPA: ABC transporter permease, partial [Longimicrobium sp.]|nr:ABC transporter permease [Longimicrobium sp.]